MTMPGSPVPELFRKSFTRVSCYFVTLDFVTEPHSQKIFFMIIGDISRSIFGPESTIERLQVVSRISSWHHYIQFHCKLIYKSNISHSLT